MLTHGNMCANILQAEAWIGPYFQGTRRVDHAHPLYHIFALMANCLLFARLGWKNVLIINPRDFPAVIAELKKYPFAYISGVNTLFNALMHAPGFDKIDFSALKITLGGGMAVQEAVAKRWKEMTGGHILTQAWGLTETSPGACINPPMSISTARSACPSPRPKSPSRTMRARTSPSAKSAKSASAARK
jgi:long-chain acyl-CoA synthetase